MTVTEFLGALRLLGGDVPLARGRGRIRYERGGDGCAARCEFWADGAWTVQDRPALLEVVLPDGERLPAVLESVEWSGPTTSRLQLSLLGQASAAEE